jgi:hypothetical protein
MTKQELNAKSLLELDVLCREIAERDDASSLVADQARWLRLDITSHIESEKSALPHPIRSGKRIGEAQEESLRRRVVDFISAVR